MYNATSPRTCHPFANQRYLTAVDCQIENLVIGRIALSFFCAGEQPCQSGTHSPSLLPRAF
jgi:hypothetical protein